LLMFPGRCCLLLHPEPAHQWVTQSCWQWWRWVV
jgi:hypothetical protein